MSNIITDIKLSGVTYQIEDSTALHTLDDNVTSGGTNAVKGSGIYDAITAATGALAETIAEELNGKADSSAVTQEISAAVSGKADTSAVTAVNDTLTAHTANTDIHVTAEDKAKWNSVSAISGYADSVQYNSTSKYMEFYHGGTSGTKVYEFDASPFLIDGMVENVEIKTLSSTTVESGLDASIIPTGGFKASSYDKAATKAVVSGEGASSSDVTKLNISFITSQGVETSYTVTVPYTSTTVDNVPSECTISKDSHVYTITPASGYKISKVVASSWKDSEHGGMPNVSTKYEITVDAPIEVLAITFNTDAGKQEIDIPLSDIFDASNYYTKSETDSKIAAAVSGKADSSAVTADIAAAVSGKADTSAVTAVNDTLTGHTADTTIHVTSSDKSTWSGKQDALVSGTNIKTINGNSILGSGDISVQTLPTVSGTTLIFS